MERDQTGKEANMQTEPRAFDLWLRRDLCRTYDPALHEPLPDAMLDLLPDRD